MLVLHLAEPHVLAANFGRDTLDRARSYGRRRVEAVETSRSTDGLVRAQARVVGTSPRPYSVSLEAYTFEGDLDEVVVETWCSCPVRVQCKHGAALCVALARDAAGGTVGPGERRGERAVAPPPTWRTRLDQVLGGLAAAEAPAGGRPALALRFTHDLLGGGHYANGAGPTVRVRPMRQGKRGWVKSDIDWRDVPAAVLARVHDPDQLQALAALHHAAGSHYSFPGVARSLADLGPHAVRLLREAEATGITLYAEEPLTGVRLLDEPATVVVDAVRTPADGTADGAADGTAGGAVRLGLGVDLDGRLRPTTELVLMGSPTHTVAAVDGGVLTLASLTEPLPEGVLRALGTTASLVVPAAEVAELGDYLSRLRRLVPLTSADGSVELPERLVPRLRVTVAWHDGSADVAWTWVYGRGDLERTCAVGSGDRLGGVRDRPAELEVLARLDLDDPDPVDRVVGGSDTVPLGMQLLPGWRAIDGLEVVERERPDLREAEEPPRISFEVADDAAGPEDPDAAGLPTDWLDLRVTVLVHGERLELPDLLAALTQGQRYLVLPSGLYLSTDVPELRALGEAVAAASRLRDRRSDDDRIRVEALDLGLLASLADVGEVDTRAEEWVRRARALRDLVELPRPEPEGVLTELRSYQREGFGWLTLLWSHGLGGILADDMGLGKTLQVLALVSHTRAQGARDPFLVVAPTSVVGAWVEQAARHTPGLRVRAITATAARRTQAVAEVAADADLVVTTYTVMRLGQDEFARVTWGGLVLDEAQQMKNHRSQAHKAVQRLGVGWVLAVTGTPLENRLTELWSLLAIVAPGLYPQLAGFTRDVARPIEKEGDDLVLERFRRRIKPFMLRRTKQLVAADLPPKQEQELAVELGSAHRELYDAHLARERQRILGLLEDFSENRVEILAALTRLRQLALDPALVDPADEAVGSAKLDTLMDHLAEITAEGHRALVFSSFTGFLGRARARLDDAGVAYSYLDGATTSRAAVIEDFRASDVPVFLISLKAGGVGLTLTEADYVYVLDPWWNPAAEAQAVDRTHRIGQERPVMVYRLVSTDTIEEKVMALKARKAALFAQVVDGGGATDGTLTVDDVRELFD